jgi:protein-S-isoprenylcysteine O-methyltransferase Ste14
MAADRPDVVVRPPLLVLGAIAVALALDAVRPAAFLPGAVQYPLGIALVALGIGLAALAMREFRRVGTNVPTWRPTLALATGGPYRFTRNPIYIGLVALYVGVLVLADSLWFLAGLVPLASVLHYGVVKREEAFLEARFGEDYRRFRAATRRWLWP